MPRRFTNVSFGPMALRPLLRHVRARGECVVGWGIGHERLPASAAFFRIAVALLPGVGHALAMASGMAGAPPRRLVVLTDRRLMVLATQKREAPRGPVIAEIDIGSLAARVSGLGTTYALKDCARGTPEVTLTIDPRSSAVTARLCRALALLTPPAPRAGERAGSFAEGSRNGDLHKRGGGLSPAASPIR